jgi:predicted RNA binding protein YcfA (HicA-like mRNA interferase family)
MRVPRQWSGADLKKALASLGYVETRQTGSHSRMTTRVRGEHHVTVPNHKPLPLGTLKAILRDVARHFECTPDEILTRILGDPTPFSAPGV